MLRFTQGASAGIRTKPRSTKPRSLTPKGVSCQVHEASNLRMELRYKMCFAVADGIVLEAKMNEMVCDLYHEGMGDKAFQDSLCKTSSLYSYVCLREDIPLCSPPRLPVYLRPPPDSKIYSCHCLY